MEGSKLTEIQIKMFGSMMHKAFEEIRSLAWVGLGQQAGALADAFHNLPIYLFSPDFSWEKTRMFISGYQRKYPRVIQGDAVSGSYYDYVAMLDEIENAKNGDIRLIQDR